MQLRRDEYGFVAELPNGRLAEIMPLTALQQWDGEGDPVGWFRNPTTGRRRPGNDPAKEYVAP